MPNSKRRTGEHALPPDLVPRADSPRLQALVADIARRLRPVCVDMPPDDFAALVHKVAEATYLWETRTGRIGREPG
jgi:hypothetical protein